MSLTRAFEALDAAVPDELVESELRALLQREAGVDAMVRVELGEAEGGYVSVPVDAKIEIVTKAFFKEYMRVPFGDFQVQIALGGASTSAEGRLTARLCFATLFYNAQGQRFTIDFHLKVR